MKSSSKKSKRKPLTLSKWKKKVWIVFSKFIRNRDNWTCFTCGKREESGQMHAGHFIPRTHSNTLFDEMNVHAQCSQCNMFNQGQPHIYAQKLIAKYGLDEFQKLVERGKEIKQYKIPELELLYKKYTNSMLDSMVEDDE